MARLLQIDVKYPSNCSVRSRKYINGIFDLKIAIFFDRTRSRKQVDVVAPTYNMEPGKLADRLKTTL